MKIVVISDSHGNLANLKHVLGFAKKIKAGAIIHCGDWDDVAAVEAVVGSGIPVYAVLGNADIREDVTESLRLKAKDFNEEYLEAKIGGKKIGIIHNIKRLAFSIKHFDVVFCGHTHQQNESVIDGVRVVNPGALEHKIEFAVYGTEINKVELVKS